MKIAIITDTHFGATAEPFHFIDHQKDFYENVFFPTLEKHNIHTILHLGDLVDRRKYIDFQVSERMRKEFLDPLKGYDVRIIAGNHDVYYKDTNNVNAFNELLSHYNFMTYTEIEEIDIDLSDKKLLLVPWMNKENRESTAQKLRQTKNKLVFGHFEIKGFEMTKGNVCDDGIDPSFFKKFDRVFSGHFHRKSIKENIYYLGSPFQMTWDDYGDERGFHLFDVDSLELEFVRNPTPLFVKYFYNDETKTEKELLQDFEKTSFSKSFCKVIVETKKNPLLLEKICGQIEKRGPIKLDIVHAQELFSSHAVEHKDLIEDTVTLIKNVVKGVNYQDKQKLEKFMLELYNEAQNEH